jgi:hypothetical protein
MMLLVAKPFESVRTKLIAGQNQPMKMRVAAALVYHQITGQTRSTASGHEYEAALSDTAIALSQVADIYYVNAEGRLLRIPDDELTLGKFERAGDVYRARSGQVYRDVMLRRSDVMDAVVILRKARETIDEAQSSSAGIPKPVGP